MMKSNETSVASKLKEWFDLVIIVPLEEELLTLIDVFSLTKNRSTDTVFRYEIETGHDLRALVVQQEGMGRTHAARAVSDVLTEFDVGLVACVGIAGSLTSDLRLGDVCYSNNVADVLDNARAVDDDAGHLDISLSLTHFNTPREVVAALNFSRLLPELKPAYQAWQARQKEELVQLGLTDLPGTTKNYPSSTDGLIVCAAVSKSEVYNTKLRAIDRKVLAVETESGGVFEECKRRSVPALTIRGISDHADAAKSELEKKTGGAVRKLAALNAATFLKLQLSNDNFIRFLNRERARRTHLSPLDLNVPNPTANQRDLISVVAEIGQHIDDQLRELSPDFKLLQRGYRLPTPRMRQVDLAVSLAARPSPIEARDVLRGRNSVLLRLSRNYPDNSLPWVLANDLLTSELTGKQPIPIVIDGEAVARPRSDFQSLAGFEFADLKDRPGVQLVFILDELPFKSRTRLRFIEAQVKLFPEAKFLFITREEPLVITESQSIFASIDTFELSNISFLEISHFVEKNFGMTGSEAEVIALRLGETFRSFDLSAHPSYFAGIPREVLSALLQANRRAELIQLAVDGFLTFVVAGDTADITLSRTTRSRFLRRLAVEINVEKRSFSQAEIVAFTTQFSKEFDFGIDPIAFVHSFIDAGILYFTRGTIEFALPFVESYVLASELASNDTLATRYFDIGPQFDLTTFDLYAEIGASDRIVCNVIEGLERALADYGLKGGETHILLTDKVRPQLMKQPDQMDVIRNRLLKTSEDIEFGRGDTAKKQQLLDIADRVREEVADRANPLDGEERTAEVQRVTRMLQNWLVGTMLLGAGAEHLSAEMKQMLASLLIEVSSIIMHRATEALVNVDFGRVKEHFQSDREVVQAIREQEGTDKDEEAIQRFIGSLVDFLEFTLSAMPMRRVLHQLCEGARQKVLATSVEKAAVSGPIESLIHAAWLADIESKRGRDLLVQAIKQLPNGPFLRSTLAAHFLERVYWNHWRKEDRLVLLSAAEECLKGFSGTLNKGELKRYIENSKPSA